MISGSCVQIFLDFGGRLVNDEKNVVVYIVAGI
jgi:hypothetical protein